MASVDDSSELVANDPESESQLELLRSITEEELVVRLSGSRIVTPGDAKAVAGLIADAILDVFQIRRRPVDKPRYSPRAGEGSAEET